MRIPKQAEGVSRGRSTSQVNQGTGVVPQACWCGYTRSWIQPGQVCGQGGLAAACGDNGTYVDSGNYGDGYDDPPYDPFPPN